MINWIVGSSCCVSTLVTRLAYSGGSEFKRMQVAVSSSISMATFLSVFRWKLKSVRCWSILTSGFFSSLKKFLRRVTRLEVPLFSWCSLSVFQLVIAARLSSISANWSSSMFKIMTESALFRFG
jgi:hypothetical protein